MRDIHFALRGWISAALLGFLAWARFRSSADLRPEWLLLVVAGGAYRAWTARFIGGHSNGQRMAEGPLSTAGPYRWSRHPLYVSNLFAAAGLILFANCLPLWGGGLLFACVLGHYALLAGAEERFLLARQGESYARYLRSTPRWLGFPRVVAEGAPAPLSAALGRQAGNLAKSAISAAALWALARHG